VNRQSITLEPVSDAASWDKFVSSHNGHLLQSFAWGELKSRFGWRVERWGWVQHDELLAGAQVLLRHLMPGLQLAYVPRGPVFATTDSPSATDVFRALVRVGHAQGIFLLKVEPNWSRDDPLNRALDIARFHLSNETIQPPTTIRLDLSREPEALLAAMKPKWRYNIRLSQKKGVVVREGTTADLPTFYQLMEITGRRDHFAIHSMDYYRAALDLLTARDQARLLVAELEAKTLAMIFVTAFGSEAIYLYGASGDEQRNVMPNHALHWAAIQWARSRGCRWYDLWGIPEDNGSTSASLPGSLYQFKQGFGGETCRYVGAWDFIYAPLKYAFYHLARRLRRVSD